MKNIFNDHDWSTIKLKNVFNVPTPKPGTYIRSHGNTDIYQIGIKFVGSTEIFYDNEKINFNAGSVLYLPKEEKPDIPYNKTILESGNGVCIFFDSEKKLPAIPKLFQCNDPYIEKLFAKLNHLYNNTNTQCSTPFESISVFYEILSYLSQKETEFVKHSKTYSRLEPAIRYMEAHFCDNYVDIEILAQSCKMTKEYFRHCFKKTYCMTPLQYINILKVNYIKKLIHSNQYSLTEIARITGFSDLNYFSRFFKKQLAVSASEYKKMYCSMF